MYLEHRLRAYMRTFDSIYNKARQTMVWEEKPRLLPSRVYTGVSQYQTCPRAGRGTRYAGTSALHAPAAKHEEGGHGLPT